MTFLFFDKMKIFFLKLNSIQIFFLSFVICFSFYLFEGLIGIDRFYHPDSIHYLKTKKTFNIIKMLNNPESLIHIGYYYYSSLVYNNYYLLIFTNFVLYSLTNVLIFKKIFKKYCLKLNIIKLIFLFYLLFLDPYRLHLASHVLKETFLIFFLILIITTNSKIIKIVSVIFLEIFRKNSWIYLIILLSFKNIKKYLYFNKKLIFIFSILFISLMVIYSFTINLTFIEFFHRQYDFIISAMKKYNNRQMPIRPYDFVPNFKNFEFPLGFIFKNMLWPFFLLSGTFIFFVSSYLFKFLAILLFSNHLMVYFISKKTFVSFGLLLVLGMISVYTSSFTAMFRYSYIAIYVSIIYFFLSLNIKRSG